METAFHLYIPYPIPIKQEVVCCEAVPCHFICLSLQPFWVISFPRVTFTGKNTTAFSLQKQGITGTCFSVFRIASLFFPLLLYLLFTSYYHSFD